MYRTTTTFSAVLLLAGAAVFMTAGPVQAQRGGHGGGGHAGGFHGGGQVGGYRGGYHGGYYHGGYGRGYGYRPNYAHDHYYGGYYPYYGYSSYYPHYSQLYPYGGGYSVENAYADDTPLLGEGVTYDSGYRGLSAQEYEAYARSTNSSNAGAPAQADNTAHVTVTVPADAEIWIDGTKTISAGVVRQFQSPPLTPGQRYNYDIRAHWTEHGHEVTQTQKVEVTAGGRTNLTFPVRPNDAG
jgi:uncharacterized protein (TIGR03000 family)